MQPLAENALYHGIKNKRGGGKITIRGHEDKDSFVIEVYDDGIGMTQERLIAVRKGLSDKAPEESELYGLYNVNERIRLNFGDEYGINIASEHGQGTVVEVRLPKILTEIVENPTSEKIK